MWENAPHMLQRLGWLERGLSHAERYVAFADLCAALRPEDPQYAARILWYFKETEAFVGIAPKVLDVCVEAAEIAADFRPSTGYANAKREERAADLARQLRGEADHISDSLIERLSTETGLYLEAPTLALQQHAGEDAAYRSDLYAAWILVGGAGAPGFRLWVTPSGVAFGLHGGWEGESDQQHREVGTIVQEHLPRGLTFLRVHEDGRTDRLEAVGREYPGGETFVGRWWKDDEAVGRADFADDIISTARALTPLLRFMTSSQRGPLDDPSLELASMVDLDSEVEIFKTERPYPSERDAWHQEQRRVFAACLSREGLEAFDLPTFKRIVSTRGYGDIGAQSVLISSINALDASGIDELRAMVRDLLWGEGRDEERINRVLATDDVPVQGFGESVVLKLFAIAHPEHWLPLFPLGGDSGKIAMLGRLGGPARWTEGKSRGRTHVETNALLQADARPAAARRPVGPGAARATGSCAAPTRRSCPTTTRSARPPQSCSSRRPSSARSRGCSRRRGRSSSTGRPAPARPTSRSGSPRRCSPTRPSATSSSSTRAAATRTSSRASGRRSTTRARWSTSCARARSRCSPRRPRPTR